MLTLEDVPSPGHERVVRALDPELGLHGYIAIHSLVRGPSLGGLRIHSYDSPDGALADALRLSEAMTYKSAAAGLPFGGGKSVIMGEASTTKTTDVLEQFGRAIDALEGDYIAAEDVGTTVDDLAVVANTTEWVAALPLELGGSGDPSPWTARGVLAAMRSVAAHLWNVDDLAGRTVLVQGLGKVGSEMVDLLVKEGAELTVADIDERRVRNALDEYPQIEVVPVDACLEADVDIASPCALGGILNPDSVPHIGARAVVGSANNQLSSPAVADQLHALGITYAPDFIVNAGGIINIASEYGFTPERVDAAIDRIGDTVSNILETAERRQMTTHAAAMAIARERLDAVT